LCSLKDLKNKFNEIVINDGLSLDKIFINPKNYQYYGVFEQVKNIIKFNLTCFFRDDERKCSSIYDELTKRCRLCSLYFNFQEIHQSGGMKFFGIAKYMILVAILTHKKLETLFLSLLNYFLRMTHLINL
jgi:hypothetical protein